MDLAMSELSLSTNVDVRHLANEAQSLVLAAGVGALGMLCTFGLWCAASAETVFQIVTAMG
jgi:hypothetical protein